VFGGVQEREEFGEEADVGFGGEGEVEAPEA